MGVTLTYTTACLTQLTTSALTAESAAFASVDQLLSCCSIRTELLLSMSITASGGTVAVVAQDLIRFQNGAHSHNDIPSVHGSGAIGLKTVQSNTRNSTRLSALFFTDSESHRLSRP